MGVASLIVSASIAAMSVGWRPMPDGAEGYECVIHVDAQTSWNMTEGELKRTAAAVPADIGPIRRVVKVVSSEPAPRRRRVTALKPVVEDARSTADQAAVQKSTEGVVLTQYNQSGVQGYSAPLSAYDAQNAGRYPPAQPVTPGNEAGSAWNYGNETTPFVAVPGQVAEAATNAMGRAAERVRTAGQSVVEATGNTLRQAGQAITPSSQQLFGSGDPGAAWNGGDSRPTPVAASDPGNRTRRLVDELSGGQGRPASTAAVQSSDPRYGAPPQAASSPYTPAPLATASNDAGAGNTWNDSAPPAGVSVSAGGNGPVGSRLDQPIGAGAVGQFSTNGAAAGALPPTAPFGSTAAATNQDRWATASDPRLRDTARDRSVAPPFSANNLGDRPLIDPSTSNPNVNLGDGPALSPPLSANGTGAAAGRPAVIDRGALDQAADRPLADPLPAQPVAATTGTLGAPAIPSSTTAATPTGITTPTSPTAAPGDAGGKVAALIAWVILSGSAAGNLYLFWSYLDVRQKYRALVRKTARAVGGRFSAA